MTQTCECQPEDRKPEPAGNNETACGNCGFWIIESEAASNIRSLANSDAVFTLHASVPLHDYLIKGHSKKAWPTGSKVNKRQRDKKYLKRKGKR